MFVVIPVITASCKAKEQGSELSLLFSYILLPYLELLARFQRVKYVKYNRNFEICLLVMEPESEWKKSSQELQIFALLEEITLSKV